MSYHTEQSDSNWQQHNADRHHREGRGQDRLGALYKETSGSNGHYVYLKSLGGCGPLDGKRVNVKKLEQAGRTSAGEKLWRSK